MRRYLALCWLLGLSAIARATERFPPPEFDPGYTMPTEQWPLPRGVWLGYLDIGLLVLALAAAGYFALRARSRHGVVGVMLASLAYFGFYRHGCICPVGAVQNVVLAIAQHGYALPLGVAAFFLLPLLCALFVGRVFCAAVCPLGAIQDIVLLKPVRLPAWLEDALGLLAYLYLGAAVLFTATGALFLVCRYDPFVAFFRLGGSAEMLWIGVGMLALGVFVGRPYCRFLCPYGLLQRWLAPFARWRVSVTPTTCIQCRLCEDACPFGALRYPTPEPAGGRLAGKARLGWLLALLPLLLAAGGALGYASSGTLARLHPAVQRAEAVQRAARGVTSLEAQAVKQLIIPPAQVAAQAAVARGQFRLGGLLLGMWLGLVIGLKLISLSVRRTRTDYTADPAACLACGRCYRYCPQEQARLLARLPEARETEKESILS